MITIHKTQAPLSVLLLLLALEEVIEKKKKKVVGSHKICTTKIQICVTMFGCTLNTVGRSFIRSTYSR